MCTLRTLDNENIKTKPNERERERKRHTSENDVSFTNIHEQQNEGIKKC